MTGKIIRITMFKVPLKENQIKLIELYKTLRENARKVYLQRPLSSLPSRLNSRLFQLANPSA
jgi:hypothetical protein